MKAKHDFENCFCCQLYGKVLNKLMSDKSLLGVIIGTLIFLAMLWRWLEIGWEGEFCKMDISL